MKKLLAMMAVMWGAGALVLWHSSNEDAQRITYRTAPVHRGELRSTISATGTIEPEEVVEVGAQVPGQVQHFGKDPRDPKKPVSYGTHVEAGTVLAQLDDTVFRTRVDQAEGRVARAEADVQQAVVKRGQADRELDRIQRLRSRSAVAEQDYDLAATNLESARVALSEARAALKIARADLAEAEANLGYTTIRSPVKGVILDRRINLGQSVVASPTAPSLFLIARDLDRLEIWSSVNEADIGSIHEGQDVRFTISSLPRETFSGKVSQVRLNASMSQNIVTYTVVVAVDNSAGRLLPYLTARVEFEVRVRRGVLRVPNAALRWQPRLQDVIPEARPDYALHLRRRGSAGGEAGGSYHSLDEPDGLLWVRQGDLVRPVKVRIGLSDGVATEIEADGLDEGMEVVVAASRIDTDPDALSILPHTWSEPPKK
jgi:HlyD family secretion protein